MTDRDYLSDLRDLARAPAESQAAWTARLTERLRQSWREGRPLLPEVFVERVPGLIDDGSVMDALCRNEESLWREMAPKPRIRVVQARQGLMRVNVPTIRNSENFGTYTLITLLGRGGMGVVHLALDQKINRLVALKRIRRVALRDNPGKTPGERFRTEAQALARLSNDGIARLHRYGVVSRGTHKTPFLDLEFVPGPELALYLAGAYRLPARRIVQIVRDIAWSMIPAHQQGVLHRDLKPQNIRFDALGRPKILDFGIARVNPLPLPLDPNHPAQDYIVGTASYCPPEFGEGIFTIKGDIYCLGGILFHLLTSSLPFAPKVVSHVAIFLRDKQESPAPRIRDRDPGLDQGLDDICAKALAPDREDRFTSMGDFAAALDQWLKSSAGPVPSGLKIEKRPNRRARFVRMALPILAATILLGAGALGGYLAGGTGSPLSGAGDTRPLPARSPMHEAQLIHAADRYCQQAEKNGALVRFLSLAPVYNNPKINPHELRIHQNAVEEIVKCFAPNGTENLVVPVNDSGGALLAVNLNALNWEAEDWHAVARQCPYIVEPSLSRIGDAEAALDRVQKHTGAKFFVPADWFVAALSTPPLSLRYLRRVGVPEGDLARYEFPNTVELVGAQYRETPILLSVAAYELGLDVPERLGDAIDQNLFAENYRLDQLKKAGMSRAEWEASTNSRFSPFQYAVYRLGLGTPVQMGK